MNENIEKNNVSDTEVVYDSVELSDGYDFGSRDFVSVESFGTVDSLSDTEFAADNTELSVSVGDADDSQLISDSYQNTVVSSLETLGASVAACYEVLILVFAFLLFEWTERKLSVIVNRFTERKR